MREDFVAITMMELRVNGVGSICFSLPAGRQALQALSPQCEEHSQARFYFRLGKIGGSRRKK